MSSGFRVYSQERQEASDIVGEGRGCERREATSEFRLAGGGRLPSLTASRPRLPPPRLQLASSTRPSAASSPRVRASAYKDQRGEKVRAGGQMAEQRGECVRRRGCHPQPPLSPTSLSAAWKASSALIDDVSMVLASGAARSGAPYGWK